MIICILPKLKYKRKTLLGKQKYYVLQRMQLGRARLENPQSISHRADYLEFNLLLLIFSSCILVIPQRSACSSFIFQLVYLIFFGFFFASSIVKHNYPDLLSVFQLPCHFPQEKDNMVLDI